ncbi:MAG TPA: cbb3-type cytochrome c oxidase subunit I, partial [Cyclobacteriaceae bacterium]|nr:cbb3-type cytochrome c oxidase subunit I [Cyclobacteriaceae bacterium]
MKQRNFIGYLMQPQNWWLPLLIIFTVSMTGVFMIGLHTYTEAPPVPDFTAEDGRMVYSKESIQKGQAIFQKYALMEYGSMFGDGAYRGPDYSAEALHYTAVFMDDFYNHQLESQAADDQDLKKLGISQRIKNELKINKYNKSDNTVILSEAQAYAARELATYYKNVFADPGQQRAVSPSGYLTDLNEITDLSAFFFWGGWVCAVERPGKDYSYTHNWPYDETAGNTPSPAVIIWSIVGSLGLVLGLGIVLYYHGRLEKLEDKVFTSNSAPLMTHAGIERFKPTITQKATYKFFYAATLLFAVQVLAGILTVHDFVGFVNFWGFNIQEVLPITITRSWHVQLSLLWISACWIGASFFVMPMLSPKEPRGQLALINSMFGLIIILVGGSFVGMLIGPKGMVGDYWYWIGHQGWEYLEPGKIWQGLLYIIFALWVVTLYRGLKPVMTLKQPWALPNWLVYATLSILVLLCSGLMFTPKTNFVIADFWRWMVIHMWAEAFFEVFTTILIGYFMVLMGLVSARAATRVIYLASLLFLGSGLLGISHNFYWNAKPVFTMALGSVFSTLQVVPLILLTLEAWRFRKLPGQLEKGQNGGPRQTFGFSGAFLFLLGVNFWNFFGAGVMGFIINLPIANYYEHGTYLTVNHGHAALMGVYGNLSLAAVLFCCQLMFESSVWNTRLVTTAFWSINIGLLLMVLLDLFPAGILQFNAVVENGLWFARSSQFIDSTAFQSLTWMRIIGGSIFVVGGVLPLAWFIVSKSGHLKKVDINHEGNGHQENGYS